MGRDITRRGFLTQSAITAATVSVSPEIVFGVNRGSAHESPRTVTEIDKAAIRRFASRLHGQALLPGDRSYESACRDWTGRIPNRPGLVVRCAGTEDVVAGVNFARDHGALVAVRRGGHGLRSTDGGMLIDLSLMKISVNAAQRVARAEPGVTVGELDKATGPSRLAAVLGECPSVGISGFTLGGGLGRLMGQHGAACDNLLSAKIVTAEGKVFRATESENAGATRIAFSTRRWGSSPRPQSWYTVSRHTFRRAATSRTLNNLSAPGTG